MYELSYAPATASNSRYSRSGVNTVIWPSAKRHSRQFTQIELDEVLQITSAPALGDLLEEDYLDSEYLDDLITAAHVNRAVDEWKKGEAGAVSWEEIKQDLIAKGLLDE